MTTKLKCCHLERFSVKDLPTLHEPTEDFVYNWGVGDDSFQANPPNATLSIVTGPQPQEIVLVQLTAMSARKLSTVCMNRETFEFVKKEVYHALTYG